jgi:hypothetical protein
MTMLKALGAAAILSAAFASPPSMGQEATQEPGVIGFNYPNSNYLTGGYGVHLPYNTGRFPRAYYRAYYGPAVYVGGPFGLAAGGPIVVAPVPRYGSYGFYGEPGPW